MIRINLIAEHTPRGGGGSIGGPVVELVLIGLLIAAGAGGVLFYYSSMEDRIAMARVKVAQEKAHIKNLAKAKRTLKLFQAKEKELKRQLKIINTLKAKKQGPVRVLDQISVRIPKQVWITSIRQRRAGQLLIYGNAESNESVAIFLKRLEDSPYFKAVDLQQIIRRGYDTKLDSGLRTRVMRTAFSVACRVRFNSSDT